MGIPNIMRFRTSSGVKGFRGRPFTGGRTPVVTRWQISWPGCDVRNEEDFKGDCAAAACVVEPREQRLGRVIAARQASWGPVRAVIHAQLRLIFRTEVFGVSVLEFACLAALAFIAGMLSAAAVQFNHTLTRASPNVHRAHPIANVRRGWRAGTKRSERGKTFVEKYPARCRRPLSGPEILEVSAGSLTPRSSRFRPPPGVLFRGAGVFQQSCTRADGVSAHMVTGKNGGARVIRETRLDGYGRRGASAISGAGGCWE